MLIALLEIPFFFFENFSVLLLVTNNKVTIETYLRSDFFFVT